MPKHEPITEKDYSKNLEWRISLLSFLLEKDFPKLNCEELKILLGYSLSKRFLKELLERGLEFTTSQLKEHIFMHPYLPVDVFKFCLKNGCDVYEKVGTNNTVRGINSEMKMWELILRKNLEYDTLRETINIIKPKSTMEKDMVLRTCQLNPLYLKNQSHFLTKVGI